MPFVFSIKDTYRQAVEAATGGKNSVLYDDKKNPSIMVCIPKFKLSDVIPGAPEVVHPAFKIGGIEVPEVWISKYQNIIHDGRAYSIPGVDPRVSINWDAARAACIAKGAGWHLMTNPEWAAIATWCKANGFQPRGNNDYGRDHAAIYERGVYAPGRTDRTLTGTGPATWNHDGTPSGIADLNGNIWEWVHGLKIIDSVAYVMQDNNFNDPEASWANTGVNIVSGMSTGNRILTIREGDIPAVSGMRWEGLAIPATTDGTGSSDYGNDGYWFEAAGERFPDRGGHWGNGPRAGVFALFLGGARSNVSTFRGFRAAFCNL